MPILFGLGGLLIGGAALVHSLIEDGEKVDETLGATTLHASSFMILALGAYLTYTAINKK